jgi:hypothetical protein
MLRTTLNQEYFHELFDVSEQMGVELEGHRTFKPPLHAGITPTDFKILRLVPGVYESALAYTHALRMADNAILYNFIAKSVGMKRGIMPSFMAKPHGKVSISSLFFRGLITFSLKLPGTSGFACFELRIVAFTDGSKAHTCFIAG